MREKASQGIFPGHAPFGYRNNKDERTIEIDPEDSRIVRRMFELYTTGAHTLSTLARAVRSEMGKTISRNSVHKILTNSFYVGAFNWSGQTFPGTHPVFISPEQFREVQAVLTGYNRPKYSKREIAFRGLMNCAYDGCMVTGEIQKSKYVYYRCTGHRGKCDLPRLREEDLALRLGEPLRGIQIPPEVVTQIVTALREDEKTASTRTSAERTRLETRLTAIRNRMDAAYTDKLDGKIPEDFWERKMAEWGMEEQQLRMALQGLKSAESGDRALRLQRF